MVGQFASEGNLGRNGNLNATAVKGVWDYESQEPFSGKVEKTTQKNLEVHKQGPTVSVGCVVETTGLNGVLMKRVWFGGGCH